MRRSRGWMALIAVTAVSLAGCASGGPEVAPFRSGLARMDLAPVETTVESAFVGGLSAARSGDYEEARLQLEWVAGVCPNTGVGSKALLTLLAVELDPRNPERSPEAAADAARRYLASAKKPAWTEPTLASLYLLSLDLREPMAEDDSVAAAAPGDTADPAGVPPPDPPEGEGGKAAGATGRSGVTPYDADPAATDGETGASKARGAGADDLDIARGAYRCEAPGIEVLVGALEVPPHPGDPLGERLHDAEGERGRLRQLVARLEQRIAQLEQELERIRATLKP